MQGIKILGTGGYLPGRHVVNNDFVNIVDTSDEWIKTRTGMSERYVSDGEPTWYMGLKAAEQAIEAAGISPEEIGVIIDTSVSPDYYTPSMSCVIQGKLGAVNAMTIDINCACAGCVYGIDMAKRYLQSDQDIKYALVIANENLTKLTDYNDRSTCVLFGDGAAAMVLRRSDETIYSSFLGADGTGAKYLFARSLPPANAFMTGNGKVDDEFPQSNSHYLYQDGREVYKFATKALPNALKKAAEKINFDINTLDAIIPHQANARIIETAAKNLGISLDKFILNIDKHANTSSASIPIALDEAIREGRIKSGDKIGLVGFGAGLTFGAIIFEL